ncbi:MAG TPA: tRNA pseudouridine(55) synthase TruB, partial [Chloroflexota bacterium]
MTLEGFLNVSKPYGWTSHDVVGLVRRLAQTRRVGHGGTLDPAATGVLAVAVGRATRLVDYMAGRDKSYCADIVLGAATTT